ncbi:MAG TPA: ABC transporter ATP-binding protein [Syntrophomonadaceae bacterium]|nr:ABC transporter ATP-binding protein [Syntrophomonadaceae bacterium]
MEPILAVQNLSRAFKDFKLDQVSLTLPRGYIMGLVGPNGAGKTTTIKLIMNLIRRDSGDIFVFGLDNRTHQKEIKQKIGFVYDENYFYENVTLEEMKQIVAPFYQDWDERLFRKYLMDFDLPPRKKIKDLSRGMKTKFSLALALSHRAELILMDEPTSGLDPIFRSELLEILQREMQDDRKGILFSTHITSDLEKIADYICFINNGQVVFTNTWDKIREEYLIVKGPKELLHQPVRDLLQGIRENDFGFEALTDKTDKIKSLLDDRAVYEHPSLDQIIVFTGRRDGDVSAH